VSSSKTSKLIVLDAPSPYDRDNFWSVLRGGTHWTAVFWRLYQKSDPAHRAALALAAPEHVRVYEEESQKSDEDHYA